MSEDALNGHTEVVKLLILNTARLNCHDRATGLTPLSWACHSGHFEIAKVLIEAGSDINLASQGFLHSPLMCASIAGHEKIVRLLLDAGADLHAQGANSHNALSYAEKNDHDAITSLLKQRGAVPPTPIPEVFLPWPDVGDDFSKVDYTKPESVLRAFILSMNRWEMGASGQGERLCPTCA